MDGKVKSPSKVRIAQFTLRKSNLASQRIFCTFINCMIWRSSKIEGRWVSPERRSRPAAAPLWLLSPTRQKVKLKTSFKPVALKHDLHTKNSSCFATFLLHDKSRHKAAATERQILEFLVADITYCNLSSKPTGNSPSLLSHPEKNKLMSNVLAWMRAKPC